MSDDIQTDIDILQNDLNRSVNKRKWSTIRQRTLPMFARPIALGAALFAGLAGMWEYLDPLAQKYAVISSAAMLTAGTAASLITPFFNKNSSPLVSKNDAAKFIDNDISDKSNPAQTLMDKIVNNGPADSKQIWGLELKRIWKNWSGQITSQKYELGHSPYYTNSTGRTVLHTGALAAAVSAALMTNVTLNDFNQAWQYQPPPPPLLYTAWVTPPDGVPSAPLYQNNMLQTALEEGRNESLAAHEGSVLSIVTYDRQGEITVNGVRIDPDPIEANESNAGALEEISEFRYTIPMSEEGISISIEGHDFIFDMTPDNNPSINILSTQTDENSPNNVVIEYEIQDDFGATGADLSIGIIDENGNAIQPLVPSLNIEGIPIPYSDRPDGP